MGEESSYVFGHFRLNPRERLLTYEGKPVPLSPKTFDMLLLLTRNAGHLVDKDELMKQLWPGVFVDEGNLTKHASMLRSALRQMEEGREYIETLPKVGYRFVAPVSEADEVAAAGQYHASNPRHAVDVLPVHAATKQPMTVHYRWFWVMAAVLVLAVVSYLGYSRFAMRVSVPPQPLRLAVLPFRNLSNDAQQEYLSDGITEVLITDLGNFTTLRVISRTSAMHYKETNKTLPEIARELHVDAVVEGSAERSGDRVRITAQLIDAADDRHLWAGSYEGDLRDALRLQDKVAEAIADEIQAKLLKLHGHQPAQVVHAGEVNPEAYQLYLQGRYFWNKRTSAALQKAVGLFQQAIDLDPEYAPAYAGLADCYGVLPNHTDLPSEDADRMAIAAATRALQIDPSLAEAYATLAGSGPNRWNWLEAERQFRRALQLNPSYAMAHAWYGDCLQQMGRVDEAASEYNKAYELDPLSLPINFAVAYQSYVLRDYDQAIEQSFKVLDMESNYVQAHFELGLTYGAKGTYSKAIEEFRSARNLDTANPLMLSLLGHAYGAAGKQSDARNVLRDLSTLAKKQRVSAFHFAVVHMGLNENDQAFELLNRAWDEHYWMMGWLKVDPLFDALRSDPRFDALVQRVGFPE